MQGQPSKGPFPIPLFPYLFVTLSLELELGGPFTRGPPGLCPPHCYATEVGPFAAQLSLSDSVRLYSSVILIYLLTTRRLPDKLPGRVPG